MCGQCHTSILQHVIAHYQEQISNGTPREERMVLMPLRVFSNKLCDEIRDALQEIDDRPNVIPFPCGNAS
jgi:hypothetical protein